MSLLEAFDSRYLSLDELAAYDWRTIARPKQLAPPGDWLIWLIMSGRGFGKTRAGAEWVIERARVPDSRIALVGRNSADVRDVMVSVHEASILRRSPPHFMPIYNPSNRRLTWPNGSIAICYYGDRPDQLRGPQHDSAWVDELAKFQYPQSTMDNLLFGLRIGEDPRVCVTTTPRPIPAIKALIDQDDVAVVTGSTFENIDNLNAKAVERLRKRYQGTRLGRQELEGLILDDVPGALWSRELLETTRVTAAPEDMMRIVVAIDPAVTSHEESNRTGIMVCGLGYNGEGYVLADGTLRGTPAQWASQAIKLYHQFSADRVVAEVNNGGEMIEYTIKSIDPTIPVTSLRASRAKHTRAEPIAARFETNTAHIVGVQPELEDELCTWTPGEVSPDRLDAMVWGLPELMQGNTTTFEVWWWLIRLVPSVVDW